MRAFIELAAFVTQDMDQRQRMLSDQWSFDDTSSTAGLYTGSTYILPASMADFAVPFGGVTNASVVIIVASQEVVAKFGSNTAPGIPIRPYPAVAPGGVVLSSVQGFPQPGLVLWTGKVSSIFLTNPNGVSQASVFVALVGNAA